MAFFGRGVNKVQNPLTFVDMYPDYIKDKEIGSPYYISYKTYADLCSRYYKELAQEILKGKEFKLPYVLGTISINKTKVNVLYKKTIPIDWIATVKYGKKIYNLNEHSRGYRYRFYWNKTNCYIAHLFFYAFNMTRGNKRQLAKMIKSGEIDYFEKY